MRNRILWTVVAALTAVTATLPAATSKELTTEERVYVNRLVERLGDKEIDPAVLTEAIGILSALGPRVMPVIRGKLNADDVILRERLCAVLVQCLGENEDCPEALPVLRKQLMESIERYSGYMKAAVSRLTAAEEAEEAADKEAGKPPRKARSYVGLPRLGRPQGDTRDEDEIREELEKAREERQAAAELADKGYWCGRTVELICGYFEAHGDEEDIDFFCKTALATMDDKYLPSRRVFSESGPDVWATVGRPWGVLRTLIRRSQKIGPLKQCQDRIVANVDSLDKKPVGRWYVRPALTDYRHTDHALIVRIRELSDKR